MTALKTLELNLVRSEPMAKTNTKKNISPLQEKTFKQFNYKKEYLIENTAKIIQVKLSFISFFYILKDFSK